MAEIFKIRLNDLRFYGKIGVSPQERNVGNDFSVDCLLTVNADKFVAEDIETTISYADVYEIISSVMNREWLLLESAARQIADDCRERWQNILKISVSITKLSPPITGIQGSCSVEYEIC